jgi:hypothetical protein
MTQPLTHARIGYDHIGLRGSLVASNESTGYPASAANNDLTYSFWKPSGLPATFEVTTPTPEECDYFGIAAHDLRSKNTVAIMQALIGQLWTTMPVLTPMGEIWTWKDGLAAVGGLSNGGTVGNRRPGYGVDGSRIVNESGEPESHAGPYSLAVEGALVNDVATNVATGTDALQSTSGFTITVGAGPIASSTDRAVSGGRSLKVPANNTIQTSTIAASQLLAYSAKLKVWCSAAGQVDVFLQSNIGQITTKTVNLNPGEWTSIHITGTSQSGTTAVSLIFLPDEEVYVDEIAIYQGGVDTSWIDTGADDASDLAYYPEWAQQLAGSVTINFWARSPSGNFGSNQVFLNIEDIAGGYVRIQSVTPSRDLAFQTSNGTASDSNLLVGPWNGGWHMVTFVLSGTSSARYFDGVLQGTNSAADMPDWGNIIKLQVGHDDGANRMSADGKTLLSGLSVVNWAATATEIAGWFASPPTDLPGLGLAAADDDRPIMRLVEPTSATRFRLRLVGPSVPTIGVIRMGKALEMERPLYGGHTPISLARNTVIRPNISERGQWLGRSIIRSGASGSWNWTHLTAAWVRRYLQPFITAARTRPFFIAWRPEAFPAEAGYCWTTKDLSAANMGRRDFMSFQLDAEGLGHE